ncbi:MAG: hypothetical protein IT285_15480 [Bdellovibrionales bacterium]|nr:hypothetical protein [Bdellovibrionales bacterium]
MSRRLGFVSSCILALQLLAGCGPSSDTETELTPQEEAIVRAQGLQFAEALEGTRERKLVAQDLLRVSKLRIEADETGGLADRWFNPIFGGDRSADVMRYLRERLRVVLPGDGDVSDLLRVANRPARIHVPGKMREPALLMAVNAGVNLWWTAELLWAEKRDRLYLDLGRGRVLAVRASRDGIIQLGAGYSDRMYRMDRMATLIHEARHSDCVGGLSREDLRRVKEDQPPRNEQCGNLHAPCPEGHAFAGMPACDAIPWGAYAVEGVYLNRVAKGCLNCKELDRQAALAGAADRFSRVFEASALLRGQRGDPDMSSRGLIP